MSQLPLIEAITQGQLRSDIPAFRPGDTVRVHARVVEGTRERIQLFEGVVIKRRGFGISETYTVRNFQRYRCGTYIPIAHTSCSSNRSCSLR